MKDYYNGKERSKNKAEKNGMWKGDSVGYFSLHKWVAKRIQKPDICPCCNINKPHDITNKGVYDRNLDNWEWLCRKCHMTKDGRMDNLIKIEPFGLTNNCIECGKVFKVTKSRLDKGTGKYCSIACYIKDRFYNKKGIV